ncbi:MAG TPA: DUF998 domain-containing protein [Gemmatimonadales bacterium]|nr:DUF998 domain-containing protein [Gemmatimonadales bacterium]
MSYARPLLLCGTLSAVLYSVMLVAIPMRWPAYSSASQTVSELSAIDAPTRALWVPLGLVWTVLYGAFGVGVWSVGSHRALRVAAGAIVLAGAIGIFWPPMHQREVLAAGGATLTDTLHLVWTAVNGLLTLVAMGCTAAALGGRFRVYAVVTMGLLIGAGVLTSIGAPGVQANMPTPWIGVWERLNLGAWLLWVFILALTLLRRGDE